MLTLCMLGNCAVLLSTAGVVFRFSRLIFLASTLAELLVVMWNWLPYSISIYMILPDTLTGSIGKDVLLRVAGCIILMLFL